MANDDGRDDAGNGPLGRCVKALPALGAASRRAAAAATHRWDRLGKKIRQHARQNKSWKWPSKRAYKSADPANV